MSRRLGVLLLASAGILALACSEAAPVSPTGAPLYLTNGPDSAAQPGPNPNGPTSSSPRLVFGTALGMGPAGDTASYSKVAGVAVTIRLPDDSAPLRRGQQVAAATSDPSGHYSLGSVKPGTYILEALPPSSSPFRTTSWGFLISEHMPDRIELGVVLYRK